ncbi:hypothetical protein CAPTEDRAFT_203386 [Capitella teleta]|uniref:Uncharacterized protein n=1 Tax=Capitella teleta TaxID=283909 RepID=R7VA06_CAPTE|nr:hypothetical protein CAPTEDRAFT_203386 [Capitella teleta]|eukprot:ELU15439.1 hypothetical protein CAPTEDRAFT_203386 [Capitella teleta]
MAEPTSPPSIYPELHIATPITTTGHSNNTFRLEDISRLKKYLEGEVETRAALYKKYRRGVNVVHVIDGTLVFASMNLGACGVGLLTTIIAAPVVIGLGADALVCGLGGVAGKFISRRLTVKENLCSFRNLFRSVLWALLSDERPFLKDLVNCE